GVKFAPPLTLYCHDAPASRPVTLTVPTLVLPSLELGPVSLASASPGAAGGAMSTVIAFALLLTVLVLPAASVWRTCTWPAVYVPAPSVKLVPPPVAKLVPPL